MTPENNQELIELVVEGHQKARDRRNFLEGFFWGLVSAGLLLFTAWEIGAAIWK